MIGWFMPGAPLRVRVLAAVGWIAGLAAAALALAGVGPLEGRWDAFPDPATLAGTIAALSALLQYLRGVRRLARWLAAPLRIVAPLVGPSGAPCGPLPRSEGPGRPIPSPDAPGGLQGLSR